MGMTRFEAAGVLWRNRCLLEARREAHAVELGAACGFTPDPKDQVAVERLEKRKAELSRSVTELSRAIEAFDVAGAALTGQ